MPRWVEVDPKVLALDELLRPKSANIEVKFVKGDLRRLLKKLSTRYVASVQLKLECNENFAN